MLWADILRGYKISWSAHRKPRVFMILVKTSLIRLKIQGSTLYLWH